MHPIKIRLSRRAKHYSKNFMHPINLGGSYLQVSTSH